MCAPWIPRKSATSSQVIRGYIPVIANSKPLYFLIRGIVSLKVMGECLQMTICLFHMTVRISN